VFIRIMLSIEDIVMEKSVGKIYCNLLMKNILLVFLFVFVKFLVIFMLDFG
jgi:hypothetical protein